jgi:hypothetical protein
MQTLEQLEVQAATQKAALDKAREDYQANLKAYFDTTEQIAIARMNELIFGKTF